MKKITFLMVLGMGLCLASAVPGYGLRRDLGRDIVVAVGEAQESVFIFGGSAVVDGKVKKSVVALGGTVTISGTVEDSVVGIGAFITLKPTAVVKKDVVAIGGRLVREPGSSVGNDTVFFDLSSLVPGFMKGGARGFLSLSLVPLILIIKLISFFIWLLMTFLVAGVFPKQVASASTQIRRSFWPIFGTGILGFIIFTGLILVSALLVLILIGIPILLFVAVAALTLRVFGQVVLYHFFGESLAKAFGKQNKPSVLGASLLGLIFVSFVGFVPVIGLLFSFVVNMLAFGVAIYTKFGTTTNWFARKQASAQPPAPQAPAQPQA